MVQFCARILFSRLVGGRVLLYRKDLARGYSGEVVRSWKRIAENQRVVLFSSSKDVLGHQPVCRSIAY